MTKVVVNCGACRHSATITAVKNAEGKTSVFIDSDCEQVRKMGEDLGELDRFASLTGFLNNPVYKSASKHLKHVACAVPSAILKAIEVEAGLNVPKDVTITFEKKER